MAKAGAAGACDIAAARAVVTSRQAGDGDPDRWVERDRAGKLLPRTWSVSETGCTLAASSCYIGRRPIVPEALDANGPNAPSMADQRELQRKNHEQAREIRRLQRELEKKEKALSEAATLLVLSKKLDQLWSRDQDP